MQTVEEFLAYSIHLEQEAATRFGELADAMEAGGNREVGQLFRRLSDYSRLHLADAKARAGFREMPEIAAQDFVWPDLESPEAAAIWGADPMLSRREALDDRAGRRNWPAMIITNRSSTARTIRRSRLSPPNSSMKRPNTSPS